LILFLRFFIGDLSNDENDNTERFEQYLLWLKNNSKSWQKVQDYWSLTSKKRIKALLTDKQSCHEYMRQFPVLSDLLGYLLVSLINYFFTCIYIYICIPIYIKI